MTQPQAPGSEEVEISLFGPGFGKSLAMHIGGGKWIIKGVNGEFYPRKSDIFEKTYIEVTGEG